MGSGYFLIYMNMSNCARILNMPDSAEIYAKCGQICLNMFNFVNMAEYA